MKFYQTPTMEKLRLETEEVLLTSAELPDNEYVDSDRDIDTDTLF